MLDSSLPENARFGRSAVESELTPKRDITTPTVLEKLKPQDFVDADGIDRQLFTFKTQIGSDIQAVFYSKEDLPFSKDVLQGRNGFILGSQPNFRPETDWQEFVTDVQNASVRKTHPLQTNSISFREAVNDSSATIFVENSPERLIDFAMIIGNLDPKWRDARKLAAIDRRYTPEVLDLIDSVIAGAHVDDSGRIGSRNKQEGEALAVLALTGDEQAKTILEQKKDAVRQMESSAMQERKKEADRKLAGLEARGIKPYPNQSLFHVTLFKPVETPAGLELTTYFDSSSGKHTRVSIHLHPGSAVDGYTGDFDSSPYVISGSLAKIVEANKENALLRMASPHDIYFTVSPGTRLIIPDGVLTRPGILPTGTIREKRDREIVYKREELKPGDIDAYLKKYPYAKKSPVGGAFSNVLFDSLEQAEDNSGLVRPEEYKALDEFAKRIDPEVFWNSCRTHGIRETVEAAVVDYPLGEVKQSDIDAIVNSINKTIVTDIRNDRVGASAQMQGGSRYGEDSSLAATAYSFGARFDPTTEAHFHEGWAGDGNERTLNLFKALERHRIYVAKESRDPNAHVVAHLMHWGNDRIGVDRKSIMAYLQNQRYLVGKSLKFDRNERREALLSGIL